MLWAAMAVHADGTPSASDTPSPTLPTVKVVDEAKDAALRKMPVAIEVLDADAIANAQLRDVQQLQDEIANLRIASEGSRASPWFVSLRGFVNPFGSTQSAAALYVDGVPMNDFYSFDQRLFDVERIEVRKGPQGTMYGANSESGVIDITTRVPDATTRMFADASLESRDGYAAAAGVSGALGTNVYASLSASRDGGDGYIRNLVDGEPANGTWGGDLRGRLLWQPDANSEIEATLLGHRIADHGGEIYVPVDLASFNALPSLDGLRLGRFDEAVDDPGYSRANSLLAALKGTWRGDGMTLRAVASWRSNDEHTLTDYDLSPQPWFAMDSRYRIHEDHLELRAQSNDAENARLNWLAGISANHRDLDELRLFDAGLGNIWELPVGAYPRTDDTLIDRDLALFGQGTWRMGAWNLTFGVRAESAWHRVEFHGNAIDAVPNDSRLVDRRLLPKLALDYRFAQEHTVYVSVSRGWQPGGFNTSALDFSNGQFRPETTTAWEAGVKGRLADADVTYALAAFRNDIRDYQDLVISETQLENYIVNAPRARTQGVEAQLTWRCADGVQVGATLGTVHAVYVDDLVGPDNVSVDGQPLGQVPHYNYSAHVQYTAGAWLARAEIAGAGSFEVHDYEETTGSLREQAVPGYATIDAKLGYRSGNWSAYVFGSNLGNRRYFTTATFGFASVALYPWAVGNVAPPRTIGIEFRWDREVR